MTNFTANVLLAIGALPVRTALARELLKYSPTAIRSNASEIMALAGIGELRSSGWTRAGA